MAHHVHRTARLGPWVLINEGWYNPAKTYVAKPDFLMDSAWRRGFTLPKRYGLSFDLPLYPSQMADAAALAAQHQETVIILNHAGMPVDRDTEALEL
jgi:predicted TIM-barrel fold metal-dependent hydrolase